MEHQQVADQLLKIIEKDKRLDISGRIAALQALQLFEGAGWHERAWADVIAAEGEPKTAAEVVAVFGKYYEALGVQVETPAATAAAETFETEDAAKYVKLPLTTFRHYLYNAPEDQKLAPTGTRGYRPYFSRADLDKWKAGYDARAATPRRGRPRHKFITE